MLRSEIKNYSKLTQRQQLISKQTRLRLLNCFNSLSTESTQTHPSPVSRRALTSSAHVKVHGGFSGSSFPSQTCTKGQSAHCCAHWLTQQVPGEMLGQQLGDTSSQREKTPSTVEVSFRISHWSLSQYTLPLSPLSEGHKQCLLPLRKSSFSTGFKVNLLFFFLWPMKSQLFSVSGRGLQMKKLSQNKEENSVTPQHYKIGFKVWSGWVHKPAELLVITDREEFGEQFFNKGNLTWLDSYWKKKFTAMFHCWKTQECLAYQELPWFSSLLTS